MAQVPTAENILVRGIFSTPIPLWLILKQSRGTLDRKDDESFASLPRPRVQHTSALVVRIKPLNAVLLCVLSRTLKFFEAFNFGTIGGAERQIPYLGHLPKLPLIPLTTPLTETFPCLLYGPRTIASLSCVRPSFIWGSSFAMPRIQVIQGPPLKHRMVWLAIIWACLKAVFLGNLNLTPKQFRLLIGRKSAGINWRTTKTVISIRLNVSTKWWGPSTIWPTIVMHPRPFKPSYLPTPWKITPPPPLSLGPNTSEYTMGSSARVIIAESNMEMVTATANRWHNRLATLSKKSIGINMV